MSRQNEIQNEITCFTNKLKTIDDMTTFVLNPERQQILKDILNHQKECGTIGHKFNEDGFCIYCGAKDQN